MNLLPDEGRTARIQKYKDERRKQLTARTATLFSANVTQRRPKKDLETTPAEESGDFKSSSEININTASTSVPIRTTRTSRLRAAAANHADSSLYPKKSLISSSVQSLVDDSNTKAIKNTRKPEKTKSSTTRRQSSRKENCKITPEKCVSEKEIGASRLKPKHSIEKNILEKSNKIVSVRSKDNKINKNAHSDLPNSSKEFETVTDIAEDVNKKNNCDKGISSNLKKENLYNNLVDINAHNNVNDNKRDGILENLKELKGDLNENDNIPVINEIEADKELDNIVKDCVVPNDKKEDAVGLLGAVCVRKVERFSELLSNLCSPYEADLLFEDILAENGIDDGLAKNSSPECSAPCRRAQPSPRAAGSSVTTRAQPPPVAGDAAGSTTKTRSRRSIDASPLKTEGSLPSSKISPRTNVNTSPLNKSSTQKTTSPVSKTNERRRSTEITSTKPSFIPLSKKAADKQIQNIVSPKQHSSKEPVPKFDTKSKLISSKAKIQKGQDKSKSDSESLTNEKYHNTKKRLISLEKNSLKDSNAANNSKNSLTKRGLSSTVDVASTNNDNCLKMSTLHETVRPHTSRLSQEMDSLAALTKQTLDRVNKLSNNLNSTNKIHLDVSEPRFDTLLVSTEKNGNSNTINYGLTNGNVIQPRGVTERLRDIDTAAQRLLDFEKQSAMFSDLSNDTSSQNRRQDNTSTSYSHTPVSILKRKSIHEDNAISTTPNHAIASPPVTFSPSVLEPRHCRSENRQRQGILKKRRSLDESQVVQRRSCSPEVSFADDSSSDISKPILKNRRSSLEDIIRNRSPDGQIQGILKRKISKEEEHFNDELSHGSPEPHGILKRKSNSSSSSSTTSSHVSIAQAVLLAAAGGAELVEEDKEIVRPILKKKSFSEERPCLDILPSDTPKPILKKKSVEHDDHDFDLPKKPILKTSKRLSSDEGHTSSFDLSGEDDRSSRRSSLLRSRASDHSGSECEATVRPILKQRGSSLTRERSQSPRPRLSFCADNDADISVTNFSSDANDLSTAGLRRVLNLAHDPEDSAKSQYPSAVLRRRNLRPRDNLRSKSLACDVNDELLSILNNRRSKVEDNCETVNPVLWEASPQEEPQDESETKTFPSIAARIKSMEQAFTAESSSNQKSSSSRAKNRDRERYKTQPVTIEEMRSITSSLEPGQEGFQAFGNAGCSFPRRPVESSAAETNRDPAAGEPDTDLFAVLVKKVDSPPFGVSFFGAKSPTTPNSLSDIACAKDDSIGEATFLDLENIDNCDRRQSTLDEIEQEVNKVRVALDKDSRALEEDDRQQAEADNWSLNVSYDSGVYNRASSRDSGPHSGEELGLIESQDIKENHAANSSNEWSSSSIERGLLTMERERKSTENEGLVSPKDQESDDDEKMDHSGFALGLVKSNSVVARASMWQQLQQKAKGTPKPLVRHSRQKAKDAQSVADRFKSQDISMSPNETANQPQNQNFSLAQSKSAANMLDRDEDAKLDEDDPAKMSMTEKMRMFNSKLTHKPPVAGLPRPKEVGRACRRTMPVLASQVQEAMDQNERLTQSLTNDNVPRNPGFKLKMELFRSASAKNTSLEYLMRQNAKFRSLDLDDDSPSERAQRMITPEVRGILKSGSTIVPSKHKTLAKGESSEGLKDEGIDSSSEEESASASSVSSSEKSCSSSDSSDEMPGPKPRRFHRKNKLKSSRTDSDLTKVIQDQFPRKIQLPGAIELKERINEAKNPNVKIPVLGKLAKKIEEKKDTEDRYRKCTKKLDEPIQLGKLRRPAEKISSPTIENPTTVLKISALNQEAKNKFFGIDTQAKKEKNIDEITAAVRKYIPPVVTKSVSTHALEAVAGASGSDGESSGGREVRRINSRGRHRVGSGVQRSATHSDMPHRGGTIAER